MAEHVHTCPGTIRTEGIYIIAKHPNYLVHYDWPTKITNIYAQFAPSIVLPAGLVCSQGIFHEFKPRMRMLPILGRHGPVYEKFSLRILKELEDFYGSVAWFLLALRSSAPISLFQLINIIVPSLQHAANEEFAESESRW